MEARKYEGEAIFDSACVLSVYVSASVFWDADGQTKF